MGAVDENGDGAPDLLVANQADTEFSAKGNLVALLGVGDGTFEAPVSYAAGNPPGSAPGLATADLNGDGKPDLIVSNSTDNDVSVLLGRGDGTFGPKTSYATVFPGANAVATGDFNGDGNTDVVVTNQSHTVTLFLGNGDGTLQAPVNLLVGTLPFGIVTGDFNGDGKQDIATANGSGSVTILLGNGNGTFRPGANYAAGSFPNLPQALVAGDFNHDGKLDLAVSNNSSVSILLGNGDGTFQPQVNYATSGGGSIAAGDFNGDGKPDLAVIGPSVTTGSAVISVLLGNVDGTFQTPVDYPSGSNPANLIAHDVNGDGILDLVVTDSLDRTVSVLAGKGDGTFQPPLHLGTGTPVQPTAVVAGDFNADGAIDLAVAGFDGKVSVYLNSLVIALNPNNVTFVNQPLGTTSAAITVTVANPGPAPLAMASIVASGDFAQTNTCGTSLAVQADCDINITFTPIAIGARTGAITITDTARTSPHTIALNGASIPSTVTVTPVSLTFASQTVGIASPSQAVTFTNSGASAVTITSIAASGDFAETNTCGTSVAPGAPCAINVTFTPTAAGARAGTLTIIDSDSGSPQTVSLSGTGVAAAPAVSLTPASLSFGSQTVSTASGTQTVTLKNVGTADLIISNIVSSADYTLGGNCPISPATLPATATCSIAVTFTPWNGAPRQGRMSYAHRVPCPAQGPGTFAAIRAHAEWCCFDWPQLCSRSC